MKEVIHINEASFERAVLQSPIPVLVDFWGEYCGPCKMLSPVLDEIAREKEGKALIAKVNAGEEQQLAARYQIQGVPTLLFFSGGELKAKIVGAAHKQRIVAQLDAVGESALV